MAASPDFLKEIDTLIRARYPLIYAVTWEEQRLELLLSDLAKRHGKDLLEWTATRGLRTVQGSFRAPSPEETVEPLGALRVVRGLTTPALVLLKDFHRHLDDAVVVRTLRELGFALKNAFTTLIIVSSSLTIPPELEKEISVVDMPLPSKDDLLQLLRGIVQVVTRNKRAVVELNRDQAEALVSAAHGLTLAEAENAFARAIADDGRLDVNDVELIVEEKSQVIRKSGLLEYYGTDETLNNIGGLGNLKGWLARRNNAFSEAARKFGLPEPKGVLLLGVQGCGKSLCAKAIANGWRLPLVRLDMGRIYAGIIGSSEENIRRAIRVVESLAPVVLWVDEIEKGLAGSTSGGGDTGVSARVFGTLLTWLQEKTAPVFVVATANRIDQLPPEMLRKGRFDEIFFVDLPTEAERADIFSIQLHKRGRSPNLFDVKVLAKETDRFSGAEIEQVVVSALYDAFADGTELEAHHLLQAIRETMPLAVTMAEDIERLRSWARTRTRPAS